MRNSLRSVTRQLAKLGTRAAMTMALPITALWWGGAPAASAQVVLPPQEEIYEAARGITGEQSPLFLFSGFDVFSTSVLLGDDVAVVAFESPTIPDGPNMGNRLIFELEPVGFGLLEIKPFQLPQYWDSGNGQQMQMSGPFGDGPTFKGLWDQKTRGFFSFELDLGKVEYTGEGIDYEIPNLRFALTNTDGLVSLTFSAEQWTADFAGSLDGNEVAKDLRFEMTAPDDRVSPAELLTLANRLMSFLLNIETPEVADLFQSPMADDLSGMKLKISLADAEWDTRSPPAVGSVKDIAVEVEVFTTDEGAAGLNASMSIGAANFTLADNQATLNQPATFNAVVSGFDPRGLALGLYGIEPDEDPVVALGGESPDLVTDNLTAEVSFQANDMVMKVPSIKVDASLGELSGGITMDSGEAGAEGSAIVGISGGLKSLRMDDFLGRGDIEPMASKMLLPMLPDEAGFAIELAGVEGDAIAKAINAIAIFDLGGAMSAVPSDLGALQFTISETKLKNSLLDLDVSGSFNIGGGGRIPVRGDIVLQLGPLFPLQGAIQQSLATPIPEVVQILSGSIVAMSILQSFAVPAENPGRFDYTLGFDGGLPTINGRDLPRIPGL